MHVPYAHPLCALNAPLTHLMRTPYAPYVHPLRALRAPLMRLTRTPYAPYMHPLHALHACHMHLTCLMHHMHFTRTACRNLIG